MEQMEVLDMFTNFDLNKVELKDDYFALRRKHVKKYITEFDMNRLMHNFRVNAGMLSDAIPLGGWEAPECGLRGHFVGHFLSACSKFAFADNDRFLREKAYEIVEILDRCAKPNGYLSAFEEEILDTLELEENRNVWAPYYTLHKIMKGLVDCYICLGNQKALTIARNLAHYINGRFEKLSFWKIDGILHCTKLNPVNEFGGMGDVLYALYELTGDSEILDIAKKFDRDYFLNNLADGKDVLTDLHANTHLPMVIAAMHRYQITGEEKYKEIAINFYHYLLGRTFANGNRSSKAANGIVGEVSSRAEHWGSYGMLADALTGGESESCCAHNTEQIIYQLFQWSNMVEFMDHLEVLKYNSILNSASHKTGLSQYHQPMGNGALKKFSSPYDDFWCCTASGIEAMSELQHNVWFKDENTILLNDFISSTVSWDEMNVCISQVTEYPDNLTSTLTIKVTQPTEFSILLKERSVKAVTINSDCVDLEKKDGYIIIHREFHNLDEIKIEINAYLHLVPLKGCENRAAVMYGNILLAGIGENQSIRDISNNNINTKFKSNKKDELEFVFEEGENKIRFIPLYRIEEEVYTVYMDITGTSLANDKFIFAVDGSAAYQ